MCVDSGGYVIYEAEYDFKKHGFVSRKGLPKWFHLEEFRDYFTNVVKISVSSDQFDKTLFKYLPKLDSLEFKDVKQNDLNFISGLTNLKILHLTGKELEDLGALASLKNLKQIRLTDISVANIEPLSKLINLKFVTIYDCKVDERQIENLKIENPACEVIVFQVKTKIENLLKHRSRKK